MQRRKVVGLIITIVFDLKILLHKLHFTLTSVAAFSFANIWLEQQSLSSLHVYENTWNLIHFLYKAWTKVKIVLHFFITSTLSSDQSSLWFNYLFITFNIHFWSSIIPKMIDDNVGFRKNNQLQCTIIWVYLKESTTNDADFYFLSQ